MQINQNINIEYAYVARGFRKLWYVEFKVLGNKLNLYLVDAWPLLSID